MPASARPRLLSKSHPGSVAVCGKADACHRCKHRRADLRLRRLAGTMKLGLEGKVVFITGGSKGLGLACARAFAVEGARVSIASRSEENLENARQTLAQENIEVVTARADFSDPGQAQAAAAQTEKLLGPIDVL